MADRLSRTGAVVIGRNEGARLVRCLNSLAAISGRIVYVDSASSDGSVVAARKLGAEVVELDMERPFTAARARSEGLFSLLQIAEGIEYVMFVDGDCEVEKGWLEVACGFLDGHADFAVACGRRREAEPTATLYNALADREWNTPIGEAAACGGDALMRISAVRAVGGFNPAIVAGEEPELCRRLRAAGWRIMRLDAAMTIHDLAMSRLRQWWFRAMRSGFGYAQTWRLTRSDASQPPLYERELLRAAAWAGVLPLGAILLALVVHPGLLLIWPAAAAAQFVRLARRDGSEVAALATLGKYAELIGALRYFRRSLSGSSGNAITYK